jgi:hypothetical protein
MTVSSETKRADYTGNGSTVDFATQFRFLQNSDVKVILTVTATGVETPQAETTDYTLVGVGLDAGGTVTMLVAPPIGTTLTIKRDVPLTQGTDYVENDAFPAESHETALDKLTMIVQQIQEELDRSIKFAESEDTASPNLPALQALKFMRIKSDRSGIELVDGTTSSTASDVIYDQGDSGSVVSDVETKLQEFVSVKDFGATTGVNSDTEFQNAINAATVIVIPYDFDLVIVPANITWSSTSTFLVYGTVNGSADSLALEGGNKVIFNSARGRMVLRTVDFDTNGYDTEKDAKAGQALRIDANQVRGDSAVFLNTNGRKPLISDDHFVGIHSLYHNGAAVPEIWGYNPVLVKDVDSAGSDTAKASLYGVEVTLSNNTAEAGPALGLGAVTAFFASYGGVTGNASAGYATGGLTAAWNEGIHLDGIKATGKGIVLADDVAPNNGMSIGLDCSSVSSFSTGAILLGNNQKIVGLNTSLAGKSLILVNGANETAVGDATINMRLQFADLKITGPTLGGSAAFPANFDAALFANVGGTAYKIPLIAV